MEWTTREPVNDAPEKRRYFLGLFISFFFVFTTIFLLWKSGIFSSGDQKLLSNEIDLSGRWKVTLSDDSRYAAAEFDDSSWCEIGVPNGFLIAKGDQGGACKDFWYDRDKFRNNTFWYRKTFEIPDPSAIAEPSLFLGSVKEKAWVYLNGKLLGVTKTEDMPSIMLIEPSLLKSGRNTVSARVSSGNARYPGLFHAFQRGIVLGEYAKNVEPRKQLIAEQFIQPLIAVLIQLLCLASMSLLLFYGYGASEKYYWLLLYFGAAAFHKTASIIFYDPSGGIQTRYLLEIFGILGALYGTAGYSLFLGGIPNKLRRKLTTAMILSLIAITVVHLCGIIFGTPNDLIRNYIFKIGSLLAFATILGSIARTIYDSNKISAPHAANPLILASLLGLCFAYLREMQSWSDLSKISHFQILWSVVSVAVISLSIREFVVNEKALSFFGRFLRPGLKEMLLLLGDKVMNDKKFFRGRKIPLVKLDISDHTALTYHMPYGMKRLFQDLWFTRIDREFEKLMFLDKNVGDGSIYFVREDASPHPCTSSLHAVLKIRDHLVPAFWREFRTALSNLIQREPELLGPVQDFVTDYENRMHNDFWRQELSIHVSLVYGFVDEGLWGLLSQSHYDVQGDLVTLAARLESKAERNEILIDEVFAQELTKEAQGFSRASFTWRTENLKGIGSYQVGSFFSSLEDYKLKRLG